MRLFDYIRYHLYNIHIIHINSFGLSDNLQRFHYKKVQILTGHNLCFRPRWGLVSGVVDEE